MCAGKDCGSEKCLTSDENWRRISILSMDTELARTFLAVVAGGSFVAASERLHVTQSTVSVRIQRLEEILGTELFVRHKAGTTLTPAGKQFQRHAAVLTQAVERARQEVGVATGFRASLTVGGRIGLWEDLLARWLPIFSKLAPDVAVRALVGFEDDLMQGLIDGHIDIGVMYAPHARPGLQIESILEERLVLVSTHANPAPELARDYIYVDWGPEFLAQHSLVFPDFPGAALTVNVGWLGLLQILSNGGSGYFPARLVVEHEAAGRVHRVPNAPEFHLTCYLCYPATSDAEALGLAIDTIRRVAIEST